MQGGLFTPSQNLLHRNFIQYQKQINAGLKSEEVPLLSYAFLLCGFGALFLSLHKTEQARHPRFDLKLQGRDLALLAVATHKITRILAKDRITKPIRTPFTEETPHPDKQEVSAGSGLRKALGDLLTCQFCLGPWVATSLLFGFKFAPRLTRRIGLGFTTVTGSDFLHLLYQALKKRASG